MTLGLKLTAIPMLLLFAGSGIGQNEPRIKPSFSVTLSAERREAKVGSPMPLKLTMTNTSEHDLHLSVRILQAKALNYVPVTVRHIDVELYDSGGNPVPRTDYGKTVRGQCGECGGGGTRDDLKPGESLNEEADLTKEFDIKKPGSYTVRAQRMDEDNKLQVKSDLITLTLTP
jgi:hypothetical protein